MWAPNHNLHSCLNRRKKDADELNLRVFVIKVHIAYDKAVSLSCEKSSMKNNSRNYVQHVGRQQGAVLSQWQKNVLGQKKRQAASSRLMDWLGLEIRLS